MVHLRMVIALLVLAFGLAGCALPKPFRTQLIDASSKIDCPSRDARFLAACSNITPEISNGRYELHFVEFDDQGWEYPVGKATSTDVKGATPVKSQTDNLMARLRQLLDTEGQNLNVIVYIHGWKHNAAADDWDVDQFRRLLDLQSRVEINTNDKPRRVVGIYVSWEGKGIDLPEPFISATFWTRKAAALRVSRGSVIELFSRLQAVQHYYNGPTKSPTCNPSKASGSMAGPCRIRSLMVGHSFGAWILYSALAGPLIESLNATRDLGDSDGRLPADLEARSGMRRPADLVVLINPAFEAVRYEPLHRAAMAFRPASPQTPLLVTVTSSEDQATRFAFPIGRFINTLFERAPNEDQSLAMTRTHGHIDRLFTHRLTLSNHQSCPEYTGPGPVGDKTFKEEMQRNKKIEDEAIVKFNNKWRDANDLLKAGWARDFCGRRGTTLQHLGGDYLAQSNEGNNYENINPNSLVWNIRTGGPLIPDHNAITHDSFLEFIRQLYDDTTRGIPR